MEARSRHLLRLMEKFAEDRRKLASEFESSDLGIVPKLFRDTIRALCLSDEEINDLELYWDEICKERLSALTGPYNHFTGVGPEYSYRSEKLTILRKASQSPGEDIFIPALRRFFDMSMDEPLMRSMNSGIQEAKSQRGEIILEMANSGQSRTSDPLGVLAQAMSELDFVREVIRGDGYVFKKEVSEWCDLALVGVANRDHQEGRFSPIFAIVSSGNRTSPQRIEVDALATFDADLFVPGFRYCQSFKSIAQLAFSVQSIASVSALFSNELEDLFATYARSRN